MEKKLIHLREDDLKRLREKARRCRELEAKVETWEKQLAEWKDKYVRLAADFDNYKKRTEKEKKEIFQYGVENFVLQLVPFEDIFSQVLKSADRNSNHARSVYQGLEMLRKEFTGILSSLGVKRIETKGQMFDPHLHEAAGSVETGQFKENEVVEEERAGYLYHDKVLRPALVKIARPQRKEPKPAA